jgi:hypothetical protein
VSELVQRLLTAEDRLAALEKESLSFLVATPVMPSQTVDIREEDASVILLRVIDHADLPNAQEALRVRVENAACQRGATRFAQNCEHVD